MFFDGSRQLMISFSDQFAPERGGRYEVWQKRPLSEELLKYCAQDVAMLFACFHKLRQYPNGAEATVAAIANQRIELAITDEHASRGTHKSNRDFL